jgi:uncharacterized integral membrane protein
MNSIVKKFLLIMVFNCSLFLILMIGLQNNERKNRINLLVNESVALPVGFIIGSSFISGSIIGGVLTLNYGSKKS